MKILVTDSYTIQLSVTSIKKEVNIMADAIQGHIILFRHANFHGNHKHVFNRENNLNSDDDNYFNDEVSSIAVIQGTWQIFYNSEYGDRAESGNPWKSITLSPGLYKNLEEFGISNDKISSLQLI